jgi:hypothetical protein
MYPPTLVIEDGSNVSGANTYFSIASADDYFASRGNATWIELDNEDKTFALIKACQYMDTLDWKGVRAYKDQELSWPRIGMEDEDGYAIDSDEIPKQLKWAQAEIAYRYIIDTDVEPDIDAGAGSIRREKVDVIEVEYFSGKSVNKIYQRVNALLNPFLKYGGSSLIIQLVRG